MSIIYEQTPGGLYPTGQRTVSTFPSGLIRVDQSFACKTSAAATHRATLAVGASFPGDSYPAMDGLKIFPEPQEKRRDDGFTEFTVSGFGRTNDTGIKIDGVNTSSRTYFTYALGGGAQTTTLQTTTLLTTIKTQSSQFVISGPVNFEALSLPNYASSIIDRDLTDGTLSSRGFGAWGIKESKITNFGLFNEVSVFFESM